MREFSELVEAAQSSDSEAYNASIQRVQQMAYATAYRYLGDHHLAQDLVQEVSAFLKIPLSTVKKRLYSARQKLKVQLQASLHDTGEHARRSSDGAEGAEICLARWWSWLILCVKAMHDGWQMRSSLG